LPFAVTVVLASDESVLPSEGADLILQGDLGSRFGTWFVQIADLDQDGVGALVVGSEAEGTSAVQLFRSRDLSALSGFQDALDVSSGDLWIDRTLPG
jgi:hypothetical protein